MAEEREYGVAASIDFPLVVFGSTNADFSTAAPAFVAGDVLVSKDGSTWANATNTTGVAQIGINSGVYTLSLTATEMQAARMVVVVKDQSSTKIWEDQAIIINTYGSTAAMHSFNRNSTGPNVNAASIGIGAITSTSIATDAITAAKIAADAITTGNVADGVFTTIWAESTRSLTTLGFSLASGDFSAGAISSGVISSGMVANIVDDVWNEDLAAHQTTGTAGRWVRLGNSALGEFVVSDTAATTLQFNTNLSSTRDDFYNDTVLTFVSGTLQGVSRIISDSSGGASPLLIFDEAWPVAPANGDVFLLIAQHSHTLQQIGGIVWDTTRAGHTTAGTFGQGVPVAPAGIGSTAFVAGAINSTAIATGAITAAKLAADALTTGNIADGVFTQIWAESTRTLTSLGFALASGDFAAGAISSGVISTGMVANIVDDVWDEELSAATHNVPTSAGRRLRNVQDFGIYDLASVWVDEVAGTSTGTVSGEDATVTNRATDFDNAQTVADAVDLTTITVTNGNVITLSAALEGYNVHGPGAQIALGGQAIGNTFFREFVNVSGTGVSSTGGIPVFRDCAIFNVTLPPSIIENCAMGGTVTVGSSGDWLIFRSGSYVAGAGAPTFDLGTDTSVTTMSFRWWSGGMNLLNLRAGDIVSVDAVSGGTVTIEGTGGTVHVRGMVAIQDNSSGVSIVRTQTLNFTQLAAATWDSTKSGHTSTGTFGEEVQSHALSAEISALNDLSAAEVNAEVLDVISVDTFAEAVNTTNVPIATETLARKIGWVYAAFMNRLDVSTAAKTFYTSTGGVAYSKALSDDGSVYTESLVSS